MGGGVFAGRAGFQVGRVSSHVTCCIIPIPRNGSLWNSGDMRAYLPYRYPMLQTVIVR